MTATWLGILIALLTLTLTVLGVVAKVTLKLASSVESLKTIANRIPDLDVVVKLANGHDIRITTLETISKERGTHIALIPVILNDIEDLQVDVRDLQHYKQDAMSKLAALTGIIEHVTKKKV